LIKRPDFYLKTILCAHRCGQGINIVREDQQGGDALLRARLPATKDHAPA
jgi:hypothetical protein